VDEEAVDKPEKNGSIEEDRRRRGLIEGKGKKKARKRAGINNSSHNPKEKNQRGGKSLKNKKRKGGGGFDERGDKESHFARTPWGGRQGRGPTKKKNAQRTTNGIQLTPNPLSDIQS